MKKMILMTLTLLSLNTFAQNNPVRSEQEVLDCKVRLVITTQPMPNLPPDQALNWQPTPEQKAIAQMILDKNTPLGTAADFYCRNGN